MHPVAERLIKLLLTRKHEFAEFDKRLNKLGHSLQCATRALQADETPDYVVMCLFHDVFGGFEPLQHGNMAGVVLRPFIGMKALMACYEHPFAMQDLLEGKPPPEAPNAAWDFVTKYDHPSFDPDYETLDLAYFLPIIEAVIK